MLLNVEDALSLDLLGQFKRVLVLQLGNSVHFRHEVELQPLLFPCTHVIHVKIQAYIAVVEPLFAYADRLFHFDFFLLTSHFLFCVIRFLDLLLYCLSVTYVLRKDKSKRDKNGTKSARKYLNLGKYNGLIKNRPLFITNYKSMRFYRFRYI